MPATPVRGQRLDRRSMAFLSAGHVMADMCQGAVPALLPFLVAHRHYSLSAASALVLAATVSSSVLQPLFGHLSDRRPLPWLMPSGVLLAGAGIAAVGLVSTYGVTFAAVVVSGLGVAAFHPEASRFANYVSGSRRATGMSLFAVGGNSGFALGPVLVTALVVPLGLHGTAWFAVLPALVALALAAELTRLMSFRPSPSHTATAAAVEDQWRPFARLGGVIALRTFAYFGLLTFIPLYFVRDLHTSKAAGNGALTVMLAAGAIGTLVGGRLADRHGRRPVVVGSLSIVPGLIAALLFVGPGPATVLLALIGGATIATFSVTVVMGQEYLPGHIGVASGVTLGLAIGLGGVGAWLLGLLADQQGLRTVLALVAVLPLAALALALTLPRAARSAPGVGVEAATAVEGIAG